jgi:hypothetical protein
MRIVLVNPPFSGVPRIEWPTADHIGLGYLAAAAERELPGEVEVRIIDATFLDMRLDDLLNEIKLQTPDVVGITCLQQSWEAIHELCASLAESCPGALVVLGGWLVSSLHENTIDEFPSVSAAIGGEGEKAFVEWLRSLLHPDGSPSGHAYRAAAPVGSLDDLALPKRPYGLAACRQGFPTAVQGSRGCHGRCSFCTTHLVENGRWRSRSAESVVAELDEIHREIPFDRITFVDDNFMGPAPEGPARAEKFSALVSELPFSFSFGIACRADDLEPVLLEKLRGAGLEWVFVGLESASQSQLDRYRKRIRVDQNVDACRMLEALDIRMVPGFVPFDAFVETEELEEDLRFFSEYLVDTSFAAVSSRLFVLIGSEVERTYDRAGLLTHSGPVPDYRFRNEEIQATYDTFCGITNALIGSGLDASYAEYFGLLRECERGGPASAERFASVRARLVAAKREGLEMYAEALDPGRRPRLDANLASAITGWRGDLDAMRSELVEGVTAARLARV